MKIYTDGSAHPTNPGPGGYGVVVVSDDDKLMYCHAKRSDEDTTNNEQELLAIVFAAARYGEPQEPAPQVFSDSAYAVNTFTDWMYRWKKNGWLKSNNKIPENLNIVKFYYELVETAGHRINLQKISGHSGHKWNELADKLAKGEITPDEAIQKYKVDPHLKDLEKKYAILT